MELVVVYGVFWGVLLGWGELWVIIGYGRGNLVLDFLAGLM
jgi:hypothetical protein